MATIEIDEQVARDWLYVYRAPGNLEPKYPARRIALANVIEAALPPELEVGWHEVVTERNQQYAVWWDGARFTYRRDGGLEAGNVRSVKYLGQ